MSKKMFLVDGSALYYRSYFAFVRNPLINSKGENTSTTFGFLNTLLKLITREIPDYLAIVFDTSVPTFRHEMYEKYKATRERMPDEMRAQYPRLISTLERLNFPMVEKDRYEADDIIGTLTTKYASDEMSVFIVSGDKDMAQLVNEHTVMYAVGKGPKPPEILDTDGVMQKFQVRPDQIVDYLALMGDSSDNIPGVPKIGKVTAKNLLNAFDSLDGIYENIDQIKKGIIKQNLITYKDDAYLSQKLATIEVNTPLDLTLDDLTFRSWDIETATRVLKELEFPQMLGRMLKLSNNAGNAPAISEKQNAPAYSHEDDQVNYKLIKNDQQLNTLLTNLEKNGHFVFDLETSSLDPFQAKIAGIAISYEEKSASYIPLDHPDISLPYEETLKAIKPIMENDDIRKYGQNLKFDTAILEHHNIYVKNVYFDSMLASYVLDPSRRHHNLDFLAQNLLDYTMIPIKELIGSGKSQKKMTEIPARDVTSYACEDADITLRICNILEPEINKSPMKGLFYNLEMPLLGVLRKMEKNGIRIDLDLLKKISLDLEEQISRLVSEIYDIADMAFNINSPQQLGTVLFEDLKIHEELGKRRPKKTKTGQISTSEQTLERYAAHPVVQKVLDYRKYTKLKNTYIDAFPALVNPVTGKIHTSYMQAVAATGRLSSTNPNLQNIPIRTEIGKEMRRAFIPSTPGYVLLSADYSQVELRIMAHLSGDPTLIDGFHHSQDIHAATAASILGIELADVTADQRRKAKEINFGIMYGMNKYGLANRLHISAQEAEEFIFEYFATYPNIQLFMRETIEKARIQGYVETMMHRRRYLPEIKSANRNIREFAERTAINTPIQGSAADMIKQAMINVNRYMEEEQPPAAMLLQVHDELVFEVEKSFADEFAKKIENIMSHAIALSVPLVVESGSGANWLEAHG